jgi:hypothetical protein
MHFYNRKFQVAMLAVVMAAVFSLFSAIPAFAMASAPPPPPEKSNIVRPLGGAIKIDPNKEKVEKIALLPPGLLPEFPTPIFPGTGIEEVNDLPPFLTLDFKVESGIEGNQMFKVATFTGKGKHGKSDGFLAEFDSGAYLNAYPPAEKSYFFFRSGQRIPVPNYSHTIRIMPAAKGIFSVLDNSCRCEELKKGYTVGETYEEVISVGSGHVPHAAAETMPPNPDLEQIRVKASDILRTPKMLAMENPPSPFRLHGKESGQPPTGPYLNSEMILSPNGGFWVQAFFNYPDWKSKFDGLFVSYFDYSNMEFSGPGNLGSDVNAVGMRNFIVKLLPSDFRAWVSYYPSNDSFNSLRVLAWVKDHSPEPRYIVVPSLSRRY